ncbi:MAG: DUF1834 domain-containing protein [Pseudomonadota bacterium]
MLQLESHIIARLRERLPGHVHVLSAADLAGVAEGSQPTPAVHVVYQGYRVIESRPDGRAARLQQTWLVVVAVRNVRDASAGSAARSDAGLLADGVIAALMGWKLDAVNKPLKLTNAPAAGFRAGFLYVPLAFEAETDVRSA